MRAMAPWLPGCLACQECGGEVRLAETLDESDLGATTGLLECGECQLVWPVLGGIPILLSDPALFLAVYRESVLASLVEVGAATSAALALVDDFVAQVGPQTPMRFGDDWTAAERLGHAGGGPLANRLAAGGLAHGLEDALVDLLGDVDLQNVLEVGPGAGTLSASLAERCERLVVVDMNLRAALLSTERAQGHGAQVAGCVADVCTAELASDWVDAVVAANVIDLVDTPEAFLRSTTRWLRRGGELVLSTPEPSLGGEGDGVLRDLLEDCELSIREERDHIPWVREHGPRYLQLYSVQAIRARLR